MPDIGETLRETRMRRRIDMNDVEAATKIRAKYLRALENEEWDLLPGPTFVKTFLRTYAEYLGLDARNLVEEYKQRYERGAHDLRPLGPPVATRRRRRGPRPVITPAVLVGIAVVLLLGALYGLGRWGPDGSDEDPAQSTATPRETPDRPTAAERRKRREADARAKRRAAERRTVRLQVVAEGPVEVCLLSAGGRRLVDARTLQAGERTRTFRGRRFRVSFGNGQVQMRVNGRRIRVPERAEPIGYSVRAGTRRPVELPRASRPVCS